MVVKIRKSTLVQGAKELSGRDEGLARIINEIGLPGLRSRDMGYTAILRIICGQQISTSAANAIGARLAAIQNLMTHKTASRLGVDRLCLAGLSALKAKYAIGIAEAIVDDKFSFRRIARMTDQAAIEEMIKLKGIGRWSAELYLLFASRRPDLWPVNVLGIIK